MDLLSTYYAPHLYWELMLPNFILSAMLIILIFQMGNKLGEIKRVTELRGVRLEAYTKTT